MKINFQFSLLLTITILLNGCYGHKPKENRIGESGPQISEVKSPKEFDTTHFSDTSPVIDSSVLKVNHPYMDTVSFKKFWFRFQQHVKRREIEEIVDYFEYPIHPIDFIDFQYAFDCDYITRNKKYEIYGLLEYNKQEFTRDFEILFVPSLVEMIVSKDASHILSHMDVEGAGFSYGFFPKEISKKCQRDGDLRFHFKQINGRWNIGVNYCC